MRAILKWIPGIVFWGWNSVFLLFVILLAFAVAPFLVAAAFLGTVPLSFLVSIAILIAVPIIAAVIGGRRKTYDGGFLLKLFFGFELPLFLAAFIRLFVLRQLNPGTALLLMSVILACAYFLWSLYDDKFHIRGRVAAALHTVPSTVMLMLGIGSAVFIGIYAVPVAVEIVEDLWTFARELAAVDWQEFFAQAVAAGPETFGQLFQLVLMLTFLTLIAFSMAVFALAPYFMAAYYGQAWRRVMGRAAQDVGTAAFFVLSIMVAGAWIGAYALSGNHAEADTVAWLGEQKALADIRDDIETRREEIRGDLVNAYLYRYRFLRARADSGRIVNLYDTDFITRRYEQVLHFPTPWARAVQSLHDFALIPLLYAGNSDDDAAASRLYERLFDQPIQKAERAAIKKALQATWNRDEAQAGLLDIDSRKVLVSEQHIKVDEFADHATVEIEEIYENRTGERQEIYYYFTLPEDAAVTGLWLGFGADRSKHDAFVVAPRGAAQDIYEREVRRRVDPALLEQVGPRQYRLRAFPVPPKTLKRRDEDEDTEYRRLRMRFTYAVPKSGDRIASPLLLEKRNAYWSGKTKRTLNGAAYEEDEWLPTRFEAKIPVASINERILLNGGYAVSRIPLPSARTPLTLAVLVDTSWSVRLHGDTLTQQLAALKQQDATIDADIFVIGAEGSPSTNTPLESFHPNQSLSYFGALSPQQMLTQYGTMKTGKVFDAVVILTDQSRYVSDKSFDKDSVGAPLWFVHVGPPAHAYDDSILDLIYRSGGGVATSFAEAIGGIRANGSGLRVADDRAWSVETIDTDAGRNDSSASLAAIAARQVVLSFTQSAANNLQSLDDIHALAVGYDIVTPWSSMIVLVNERQRQALKDASEKDDRFDREANTGKENLTGQVNTDIPEPETWMLMILGLVTLLVLHRHRRARP